MNLMGDREKIRFNNYGGIWLNEKSFLAGAATVGLSVLVGIYLTRTLHITVESEVTALLASIFTGLAAGHYLGIGTEKVGSTLRSYLLGASVSAGAFLASIFGISLLSGILVLSATTVFLVHSSGMSIQNRWLERTVEMVAGRLSVAGILSLVAYHYIVPAGYSLYFFLIYHSSLISLV